MLNQGACRARPLRAPERKGPPVSSLRERGRSVGISSVPLFPEGAPPAPVRAQVHGYILALLTPKLRSVASSVVQAGGDGSRGADVPLRVLVPAGRTVSPRRDEPRLIACGM